MSWLWLNPSVMEDSRMRVPRLMDPAFGVWIVNDCPYARRDGAEVMLGRTARVPSLSEKDQTRLYVLRSASFGCMLLWWPLVATPGSTPM